MIQYNITVANVGDIIINDSCLQLVVTPGFELAPDQSANWQPTDTPGIFKLTLDPLDLNANIEIPAVFILSDDMAVPIQRPPSLKIFHQNTESPEASAIAETTSSTSSSTSTSLDDAPTSLDEQQEPSITRLFLPFITK